MKNRVSFTSRNSPKNSITKVHIQIKKLVKVFLVKLKRRLKRLS